MTARLRVVVLAAAAVLAALAMRRVDTSGPPLRDFEAYYAAGATWRYHGDAYGRDVWRVEKDVPGVVASRDELLPFVGPPYGLPLWEALSRLPWKYAAAVWRATLLLALGAILLGSLRLAGGRIGRLDLLGGLAFCIGFAPLTSGIALGQVAILATAAIVAVPFALRPRGTLAATACALVAALQPNLAVVLVARLAGLRSWLAFAGAALIALLGSMVALGDGSGLAHYLDVLRAQGAAERFIAIQITPGAVARALGAGSPVASAVALVAACCVIAGVALQVASRRYAPDARLALACAALPLALPFAHEHDLAITLFPALLTLRRARGRTWVAATVAALAIGADWIGLSQRPWDTASTALFTLGAALGAAVLARERLALWQFSPALMAAVVFAAGTVAAAHPLGTWPASLGTAFHVPEGVQSAAEVWRLEQTQAGIVRLDPAWGALRLASLLGCALLWFVAGSVLREPLAAPRALARARRSGLPAPASALD